MFDVESLILNGRVKNATRVGWANVLGLGGGVYRNVWPSVLGLNGCGKAPLSSGAGAAQLH